MRILQSLSKSFIFHPKIRTRLELSKKGGWRAASPTAFIRIFGYKTGLQPVLIHPRIGGIEETVAIIDSLSNVSENKILHYLSLYKNQFLYQKSGYLLWHCRNTLGLTDHFFSACREHIGKSKRYLTADMTKGVYIGEWNLVVSSDLLYMKNGEDPINAAV